IRLGHHVGQDVVQRLWRNYDGQSEFLVVSGHADVVQILRHAVAGDGGIEVVGSGQVTSGFFIQTAVASQSTRNLTDPVSAKVEADAGVLVADSGQRLAAVVQANERNHEFVG